MTSKIVSTLGAVAVGATLAFAEGPEDSSFGAERRWIAENPAALEALGEIPKEDLGRFLSTYQGLSPEEKGKLRDHAGELRDLSPEERQWALDNPDTVRTLGDLPDEDRGALLDAYRNLSPESQRGLREGMGGGMR